MSTADTLRTGLTTLIGTALGAEYVELPYTIDAQKNKFRAGIKSFALLPGRRKQVDGVTSFATFDQSYGVWLTEAYPPGRQDDAQARSIADTLLDRMEDLYRSAVADKAGSPGIVMSVSEFESDPVEYIDGNMAVLKAQFTIKYRIAL